MKPLLPNDEPAVEIKVLQYQKGKKAREVCQWVVDEVPVTLYFNGQQMITLMCAGKHLDELAVGFFIGEGWIRERKRLLDVQVDEEKGIVNIEYDGETKSSEKFWLKRAITSGCAKGSVLCDVLDDLLSGPLLDPFTVSTKEIWDLMTTLNKLSRAYKKTRGVHNCLLATSKEPLVFRCDIGRHNALDMIIGRAFLDGIELQNKLFITTGRLTSEVVIKTVQAGIPVLVSRHTATKLAIELANTFNLTMIGYVRGNKMTVYTGMEHIEFR